MVSSLQQRETWYAPGTTLLFTDHQSVSMKTPARVQVEVKHWGGAGGMWSEDQEEIAVRRTVMEPRKRRASQGRKQQK